jgi:hypothetical protein
MELEVVQHVGHLPRRTFVADEVIHRVESEWLAVVAGVDMRGDYRRGSCEVDPRRCAWWSGSVFFPCWGLGW